MYANSEIAKSFGSMQCNQEIEFVARIAHIVRYSVVSKTFPTGALHLNKEHIFHVDLATNYNGHLGHRLLSKDAVSFSNPSGSRV